MVSLLAEPVRLHFFSNEKLYSVSKSIKKISHQSIFLPRVMLCIDGGLSLLLINQKYNLWS